MNDRPLPELPDGKIDPGTPEGEVLGFTLSDFAGLSYLWRDGDTVYISAVMTNRRRAGVFRGLCERILAAGLTVKIPTPLGRMREIVSRAGYRQTWEYPERVDYSGEAVEVWVREPDPTPVHAT